MYILFLLKLIYNRNQEKYTNTPIEAKNRRILITKWVGQAVDDVSSKVDIKTYFVKTECAITATGAFDASIINIIFLIIYFIIIRNLSTRLSRRLLQIISCNYTTIISISTNYYCTNYTNYNTSHNTNYTDYNTNYNTNYYYFY